MITRSNAKGYRGGTHLRTPQKLLLLALCLLATPTAHPQGCSECRESVNQTPIRTQTAYRRAIFLMVLASGSVFTAGVVILKRFR